MAPPTLIQWDTNNVNILEPDAGHIADGWAPNEKPTSTNHNWMFQNIFQWISSLSDIVPIGTILPWDDFNGLLSFDTYRFQYCDGTACTNVDSPLFGMTIRDLSGRALVGFGTDGGGDIGAPGVLAIVGNPGNLVDLTHDHSVPGLSVPSLSVPSLSIPTLTVDGLSYSGTTSGGTTGTGTTGTGTTGTGTTGGESNSHTHSTPNHQHQLDHTFPVNFVETSADARDIGSTNTDGAFLQAGQALAGGSDRKTKNQTENSGAGTSGTNSADHTHSVPGLSVPGLSVPGLSVPGLSYSGTTASGETDAGSTGTGSTGTGTTGTGTTGNGLGSTNIQPISSQVRFIMRII